MQLSFRCNPIRDIKTRLCAVSVHYYSCGRLWHLDPKVDEAAEGVVWNICVSSVPRQFNANIRSALIGAGLPKLAQWIAEPRSEIWFASKHTCLLYYSPDDDLFTVTEHDW